jgi:mRNA interferase MazF
MGNAYCPKRGDIVWLSFTPQAGHEQAGLRPALTLSPESYNRKVGLAIFCPITSQVKGYPFEVAIPQGSKVNGAILADQVKSLDWQERRARFHGKVSDAVVSEVLNKLGVLLGEKGA